MSADSMARGWARQWKRATLSNIADGTSSQRESFLTMTERQYDLHRRYGYEQLEVAVPLRKAGSACAFNEALYDDRRLNLGFRSQALLRFVGPESAWLSPAHGRLGTLYVNIEDFIKYSRVIDSRGILDSTPPCVCFEANGATDGCTGASTDSRQSPGVSTARRNTASRFVTLGVRRTHSIPMKSLRALGLVAISRD